MAIFENIYSPWNVLLTHFSVGSPCIHHAFNCALRSAPFALTLRLQSVHLALTVRSAFTHLSVDLVLSSFVKRSTALYRVLMAVQGALVRVWEIRGEGASVWIEYGIMCSRPLISKHWFEIPWLQAWDMIQWMLGPHLVDLMSLDLKVMKNEFGPPL